MKLLNLFSKLKESDATQASFVLYEREERPSALQGWFFNETAVEALPKTLADTGLNWIWESTRTGPPLSDADEDRNPEHRPRQTVTELAAPTAQHDLLEKNVHGFRRFVAFYGGSEKMASLSSDDDLRREVEEFAAGKPSELIVLLVQMGDVAGDVLYFDVQSNHLLPALLKGLCAPQLGSLPRMKYADMTGEDLETVMEYLSCAEHDH